MLKVHVAQRDQPWFPEASTALLSAAQRTECEPIPLTGTCALAPLKD
jgi:hypothetical protein